MTTMMSSKRIEHVDVAPAPDFAGPCITPKTLNAVAAAAYIMPNGAFSGLLSTAPKPALAVPAAALLLVSHQGVLLLYRVMAAGDIFNASLLCSATPASSCFTCCVRAGKFNHPEECQAADNVEFVVSGGVAHDGKAPVQLVLEIGFHGGAYDVEKAADASGLGKCGGAVFLFASGCD
ncbi:hypothetical protein HPB52_006782 [Rhipicephalus sanguineus]|uniref:Uncharacterized protein n=1 Tax=Rhipicephalus sanguineus TaxID=34632 RepID=A0A9D4QHU8_RHISA|nr:hypothetical protein HPB52_006782 [Rhipicephalus sanguineus]